MDRLHPYPGSIGDAYSEYRFCRAHAAEPITMDRRWPQPKPPKWTPMEPTPQNSSDYPAPPGTWIVNIVVHTLSMFFWMAYLLGIIWIAHTLWFMLS
jgi:hypothetical protein